MLDGLLCLFVPASLPDLPLHPVQDADIASLLEQPDSLPLALADANGPFAVIVAFDYRQTLEGPPARNCAGFLWEFVAANIVDLKRPRNEADGYFMDVQLYAVASLAAASTAQNACYHQFRKKLSSLHADPARFAQYLAARAEASPFAALDEHSTRH